MKPSLRGILVKSFLPVFSAIILVAGIAYAVWTEPTAAPPNGNVGAPINTSSTAQTKAGGFTAETLTAATVKGTTQFCLGASCITAWPSGGGGGGGGYVPPPCECSTANFIGGGYPPVPCGGSYSTGYGGLEGYTLWVCVSPGVWVVS